MVSDGDIQMLTSPCEEVVKLALSGLDRIVFKNEVAIYAVRVYFATSLIL
jgi:hypothetical protein